MLIDLEFRNLRITEKNTGSGKEIIFNNVFKALQNHILENDPSFDLVINFFNRNKDNSENIANELQRIDDEILEFKITGYPSSELEYLEYTKDLLKFIYKMKPTLFNNFRSDFTEHLGFTYLATIKAVRNDYPKSYSRFFHEPHIYYKRSKLVQGDSVVDNIHINRKSKILDLCECKANVNTFLGHLSRRQSSSLTVKSQRTIQNAHNKFEYMKKVKKKIDANFNEGNCEIIFLTYIWDTTEIRKYDQYKNDITFICAQDMKKSFEKLKTRTALC